MILKSFTRGLKPFWILLAVFIALNILTFDTKYFTGGDNAHYLILAKSIQSGQGYRDLFLPNSPAHTTYPYGFPIILAAGIQIFGFNLTALKSIILLFSIGSFIIFYKMIKNKLQNWWIPLLLFAISPLIIKYSHYTLSDIPYLFFSLLTIYIIDNIDKIEKRLVPLVLSTIVLGFTYWVRTAGITLILAVLIWLVYQKQYRYLFYFGVMSVVFIIIWQLNSSNHYLHQFLLNNPYNQDLGYIGVGEFITRITRNFYNYIFVFLPQIILPTIKEGILSFIAGLIFLCLILRGLIISKFSLWTLYSILFFGLTLCINEIYSGDRYILPIMPFIFYYIFAEREIKCQS